MKRSQIQNPAEEWAGEIPAEWTSGPNGEVLAALPIARFVPTGEADTTEPLCCHLVILGDGTGVVCLTHKGGARFCRSGPANRYALEERFVGSPAPFDSGDVWRRVLSATAGMREQLAVAVQNRGGRA